MVKKIILILFAIAFICIAACSTMSNKTTRNLNNLPLKDIYKNDFLMGNIINHTYMDGDYFNLLKTHFNTVTCENAMKPDHLGPVIRGGAYRFAEADRMVDRMIENDIQVHGHVLVWHSQSHAWMTNGTPEEVRENMADYINTVLEHYKGRVFSWDVVNEAFANGIFDPSNWRNCLRFNSGWYQALGPDFIELAFRTARAADPDITLYYNDYGLNNRNKAIAVSNMVREINDKYKAEGNTRNLIEGIGMQGHYGLWLNVNDVRNSLGIFRELGVEVSISELDVESYLTNNAQWGTNRNSPLEESQALQQARLYAQLFRLFRENSDIIKRVTFWGMDDKNNWKSIGNPCLFDGDLKPKPAFFAVLNPDSY